MVTLVFPCLILSDRWLSSCTWRIQIWGGLPIALGGIIFAWSNWELAHMGFFIDPEGRPGMLVVSGPYRFTRNPLYVAVLTILAGGAVLFESVALGVYTFMVWRLFALIIRLEEHEMVERFGDAYKEYESTVSRWIRLRKHSAGTSPGNR